MVLIRDKAGNHANCCGERNRDQHTDKAKERAKDRKRENEPNRMEADRRAYKTRGQEVALYELARKENCRDEPDGRPVTPELEEPKAYRKRTADEGPDIRDEGDKPGNRSDDKAELQADKHQGHGIIEP